jgi:hypothetical protein
MTTKDNNIIYIGPNFMPDGTPASDLLTEEETIKFLRLDIDGPQNPKVALKHFRDKGLLRPTKIKRTNCYQRKELLRFLDLMTERKTK